MEGMTSELTGRNMQSAPCVLNTDTLSNPAHTSVAAPDCMKMDAAGRRKDIRTA